MTVPGDQSRAGPPGAGVTVVAPGPAFARIYQEHFGYVWQTLRRLGAHPAELEDLAHDIFLVVHRRHCDYDPARPLRPWLFGITFRVASEHRRRRASNGAAAPPGLADEIADHAPSPEGALSSAQARQRVARALDQLPLDQRAVLVMHDIDGTAVPEIANALALPLNTTYSRLRLARKKLVAALAIEGETP